MNKQGLLAAILAAVGFFLTKYLGLDLKVADGVTVNNEALVWANAVLGGVGGWFGANKLPDFKVPKLGGASTAKDEFMRAMDAYAVLDEFLGDDAYSENSRRKVMLAIRSKCRGVPVVEDTDTNNGV